MSRLKLEPRELYNNIKRAQKSTGEIFSGGNPYPGILGPKYAVSPAAYTYFRLADKTYEARANLVRNLF